jgi:hypothetical protein
VTFDPKDGKTRVRIVQGGLASAELRDDFGGGWGRSLKGLERLVDARLVG